MNDALRQSVSLQFYLTAEHSCSYLPAQKARSQVAIPAHKVNTPVYSELIRRGFRRSSLHTYRPACDHCQACVPVRVAVDGFRPGRTHRKVINRNRAIEVRLLAPRFDEEHFQLYQRYQVARHAGGGMDHDDPGQYEEFMVDSHVDSWLLEFREAGQLRMVSVIDAVADGLSAVYTFFDPDFPQRSFGVFNVLWQIDLVRRLRLPYLYLGYWVRESRKMAYKIRYQPLEGLVDGVWQSLSASDGEDCTNDGGRGENATVS